MEFYWGLHSPFFVIYNHSIQIKTREGWLPTHLKTYYLPGQKSRQGLLPFLHLLDKAHSLLVLPLLFESEAVLLPVARAPALLVGGGACCWVGIEDFLFCCGKSESAVSFDGRDCD